MNDINYNIVRKSINDGLNKEPIGNGGYIKLLEAPTSAEVLIHLNEQNTDGIPLKAYHSIEADGIERVYISCNAVVGETIQIAQAKSSNELKIITPVSDIAVEEIGGYSATALSLLDKTINPYELTNTTHGASTSAALVTLLEKTLSCDKIKINFSILGNFADGYYFIRFSLDGVNIGSVGVHRTSTHTFNAEQNYEIELEDIKNKLLNIHGDSDGTNEILYTLREYTLKP